MTDAWEEITGQTKETFEQAMARSNAALRPETTLTEQQLAEREIAGRERMRRHDARFADDFISGPEAQLVSRALAHQLGSHFNDSIDTPGDDE